MHHLKYFLILFFFLFAHCGYAQTQRGIVKTRGRLSSNGTVIPGTLLSGVIVNIKGRPSLVTNNKGEFFFQVNEQYYYLLDVKKNGYVLSDPDVLEKPYTYSKNPLVVVMETPSQQMDDKLAAERGIRRTLQRQLRQKEDEIEKLKEEKLITEEEYRQELKNLNNNQVTNEKLIDEMAKRYSQIDYDIIDEFQRQVSFCILNGQLSKADSLLTVHYNIQQRLEEHRNRNNEETEDLESEMSKIEQTKVRFQEELEELAKDCFSIYEIRKMKFENDSAAYYLELRANLDTTNIQWNLDAGLFIQEYLANYDKALSYYKRALAANITQFGENHPNTAICCHNIGTIYEAQGLYIYASEYYNRALSIRKVMFGNNPSNENRLDIASSFNNIGSVCMSQGNYEKALEYYKGALAIQEDILRNNNPEAADSYIIRSYNNIGMVYYAMKKYDMAIECYNKSLQVSLNLYGNNHPVTATCFNDIGVTYENMGKDSIAMEYHQKALHIRQKCLGLNHPDLSSSYINIGSLYDNASKYNNAIECYNKALQLLKQQFGENHEDIAMLLNNIGITYYKTNDFKNALDYLERAVNMLLLFRPDTHPDIISIKDNINKVKSKMYGG